MSAIATFDPFPQKVLVYFRPALLGLALALTAAPAVALPVKAASAKTSTTTIDQVARRLAAEAGAHPDASLAQHVAAGAPGMAQASGAGSAIPQAVSTWPCNNMTIQDTDPYEGNAIDVTTYAMVCNLGVTGMRVVTAGGFNPSQLDGVEIRYNTDDDATNGYFGADYVVDAFYDPSVDDVVVVVLRSPTSNPNDARLVTFGGAFMPSAVELDIAWPSWAWTTLSGFAFNGRLGTATGMDEFPNSGTWVTVGGSLTPTPANPWGQSRFVPLGNPVRLLDTRTGIGAPAGKRPPNSNLVVPVRGQQGIPDDPSVQAVVMNVTAVDATGPGYVQVLPTGVPGDYSNLNAESTGHTIPNLAVVPIGSDGSVTFYTQGGAHLLADVSGYFVASGASGAGRYVPAGPVRVLDTRNGIGAGTGRVPANGTVTVNPSPFVPVGAASAVVLNVTAVQPTGWGFVTAYPTGQPLPNASNLNMVRAGQVIPNLVIVPVGPGGTVNLTTSIDTYLIADVLGYFTSANAASTTSGLYVPVPPQRVRDTRLGSPNAAKPFEDDSVEVGVLNRGAIPASGVTSVLMNLTATQTDTAGFVTAFPSEGQPSPASNLNFDHAGQTIANSAIVRLGASFLSLQTSGDTHLLADTFGYFTA